MVSTAAFRLFLLLVVTAAASAACSSDEDPDIALPADPTVEQILDGSAEAMRAVESAEFSIAQTGADVFIDPEGLVQFVSADGRYAAPASADAIIRVRALGVAAEVGAVAIDGETWITNPLTQRWEVAPAEFSFDPAVLFDEEQGWPTLLTEGLTDPELVETTDDRHQIRGVVDADRVSTLTGGLVQEPSEVDLWIDVDSARVREVAFDVDIGEGPTSWTVSLDEFDAEVTIVAPEVGSTA